MTSKCHGCDIILNEPTCNSCNVIICMNCLFGDEPTTQQISQLRCKDQILNCRCMKHVYADMTRTEMYQKRFLTNSPGSADVITSTNTKDQPSDGVDWKLSDQSEGILRYLHMIITIFEESEGGFDLSKVHKFLGDCWLREDSVFDKDRYSIAHKLFQPYKDKEELVCLNSCSLISSFIKDDDEYPSSFIDQWLTWDSARWIMKGDVGVAKVFIYRHLERFPYSYIGHFQLANVFYKEGKWEQSMHHLEKSIEYGFHDKVFLIDCCLSTLEKIYPNRYTIVLQKTEENLACDCLEVTISPKYRNIFTYPIDTRRI